MNRQLPPGRRPGLLDLLVRGIAVVVTALVVVATFFVGAFVALVLLGVVAIVWLVFAIRWWQLKRQWRARRRDNDRDDGPGGPSGGSTTVDGDYRVVDERRDRG